MDLNEFLFRDDTAEALGVGLEADDDAVTEETHDCAASAKAGLAVIGSAVVGLSHFLGQVTKDL
jgi:hypothetical protein